MYYKGSNPTNGISLLTPCLHLIQETKTTVKAILDNDRKRKFESSTSDEYVVDPDNPNVKVLYSSLTPLNVHGESHRDIIRVENLELRNLAA